MFSMIFKSRDKGGQSITDIFLDLIYTCVNLLHVANHYIAERQCYLAQNCHRLIRSNLI